MGLVPEQVFWANNLTIDSAAAAGQVTSCLASYLGDGLRGVVLVANDAVAPSDGPVSGFDLDEGNTLGSTFASWGAAGAHYYGTHDQDLVALDNGDVLYLLGTWSRQPPGHRAPPGKPPLKFLPRRTIAVWRSTDTGQTFSFDSLIDPSRLRDIAAPTQKVAQPVETFGVSHGQVTIFDRRTRRLYLVYGDVGHPAKVSNGAPVMEQTLLLSSSDYGATWTFLTSIPRYSWRWVIVPLSPIQIALVDQSGGVCLLTETAGAWDIQDHPWQPQSTAVALPATSGPNACAAALAPGGPILIGLRCSIDGVAGYGLATFDPSTQSWTAMNSVVPTAKKTYRAAVKLTMIGTLPDGPVLMYWLDLNRRTQTGTVWIRLQDADTDEGDFGIGGPDVGTPSTFPLKPEVDPLWYAAHKATDAIYWGDSSQGIQFFSLVWVQPDGKIYWNEVNTAPPKY